jgi:hypothetical protein
VAVAALQLLLEMLQTLRNIDDFDGFFERRDGDWRNLRYLSHVIQVDRRTYGRNFVNYKYIFKVNHISID